VFYLLYGPSSPNVRRWSLVARKGEPNKDMYIKAKTKYKTYNADSRTDFGRLNTLNSKQTLTLNKNPAEHATFYHLNELRMLGDIR
jgi:hypothetical protein